MRFLRLLALSAFLALLLLPAATLAQQPATVTLQPVAFVPVEGETFTTDVTIENATDLLGFQFDVNFDPTAFSIESIELGPFLSNSGRSPQPLGPDVRDAANGRVVYGGFSLGSADQAGAAGSGVLATITWKVLKSTDFTTTLSRIQLAGPGGQLLPGSSVEPAAAVTPAVAAAQPVTSTIAAAAVATATPAVMATPAVATAAKDTAGGIPPWIWLVAFLILALGGFLISRRQSKVN